VRTTTFVFSVFSSSLEEEEEAFARCCLLPDAFGRRFIFINLAG
jgi:hypothetical protein